MTIQFWPNINGKILFVGGKIAMDPSCCCGECPCDIFTEGTFPPIYITFSGIINGSLSCCTDLNDSWPTECGEESAEPYPLCVWTEIDADCGYIDSKIFWNEADSEYKVQVNLYDDAFTYWYIFYTGVGAGPISWNDIDNLNVPLLTTVFSTGCNASSATCIITLQ